MTSAAAGYEEWGETARLFVAIRFPEEVRERIAEATTALRELPGVRWGRPAQYHLTLRFLGDTGTERIPVITDQIREAARPLDPFDLTLEGAGAFPSVERARVIWAGIRATDELSELHQRIERALEGAGFQPEPREFRPHVTLGRVRRLPPRELSDAIEGVELEATSPVSKVSLMESRLGADRARHIELATAPLRAP
ncbi:MAG: RNA 2',3'-cyclic phosphodiesterase [Gemmatimonadota bacterium]|nr:RNA 2',3'-cyclic phosphodiesterase [Gemmatimonadota bacterium]